MRLKKRDVPLYLTEQILLTGFSRNRYDNALMRPPLKVAIALLHFFSILFASAKIIEGGTATCGTRDTRNTRVMRCQTLE